MTPAPVPVLWLCGPPAVGTSSVAWEIFTAVADAGIRAAYLDLGQLGWYGPAPADDPENHRVRVRNAGAAWSTYRAAGARCLVMVGQVTDPRDVQRYAGAVPGAAWTLCRLRASPARLTERILLRGAGPGPRLPGAELLGPDPAGLRRFTARAARTAAALDRAGIGDLCVDTDDRSVEEVAALVRAGAGGWPRLRPARHGPDRHEPARPEPAR